MVDNYKRHVFLKSETKKFFLKYIIVSQNATLYRRYLASFYLTRFPKITAKTFVKDRCVVSGRSTGINRQTGYGRFVLRQQAYASSLPGFRRAS